MKLQILIKLEFDIENSYLFYYVCKRKCQMQSFGVVNCCLGLKF